MDFVNNAKTNKLLNLIHSLVGQRKSTDEITNHLNRNKIPTLASNRGKWHADDIAKIINEFKLDTPHPKVITEKMEKEKNNTNGINHYLIIIFIVLIVALAL